MSLDRNPSSSSAITHRLFGMPLLLGIAVAVVHAQCTSQALQVAQQQLYKTAGYITTTQYPLATEPPQNHWNYNSAGADWNSGFFPGWLWYMYEQTLDSSLLSRAQAQTQNLSGLTTDVNQPLGYWLLPSYGLGYSVTRDPSYMNALQTGAGTFATMWVPSAGVLNTQPSYHSGTLNVIIDDMPSIELLFYAAAQNPSNPNSSNWYQYAYSHSLKMAQNNVRSDGSTYQGTEYNSDGSVYGHFTVNGASVDSTWSRGQAFAIYGFTMAYRYTHDASLLAAAQQTADYWLSHAPADDVPYWDYTQSNYKDSSAAAIAAAGLLELSTFATGTDPSTNVLWSAEYDQAALNIQASLSNPATYLGNTSTTDGTLLHGAYYVPGNLDDDNSLIWGDYYFIQGCYRALAPPPQVTGLTAGTVAYNQVPLSWQAQSGAIRYNVKRGAVSGGPYTVIAPPPVLTANSYTDTSVAPSTTYYYVVSASSVAGEGPNSAELVVTTPATPPDFSLSASPATLSVSQSGSAMSTIAVSAVGGFGGPVSLSASSSPAGPVASFNPATVTGSGSAIMTVTANGVPAGTYTLTVTGTSGTLAHATSVTVTVTPGGSFTITANPASLTVSKSTSPTATSTISVASSSGFAGTVSLSVGKLPRAVKASISPNSVSVSPATPGAATLTLTVGRQASTGIQPITVIGTSSGVPQATVTVQLQVNN